MSSPGALKALVALSGGVDSAVAAALTVAAGYEVVGVHLALGETDDEASGRGCRSQGDREDARHVAEVLGIPFEVWDLSGEFSRTIVDEFVAGYAAGLTPNPCVTCNRKIKFQEVLKRGAARGFDLVSTGHYAQMVHRKPGGRPELHRARDGAKDQSYVLAALGLERLGKALFPLGEMASKAEVRKEAEARGFRVHDRPESLDACFIPDGDLPAFLQGFLGDRPGVILDDDGRVVGEHRGAYSFTIGQRKGLKLPRPAADGKPRFVLRVDPESNTVVVGPKASLEVSTLHGTGVVWLADDMPAAEATPCLVQVRAHGVPVPGRVTVEGESLRVDLDRPMTRIAAGQAIVVYDGTRVLGQATATPTP